MFQLSGGACDSSSASHVRCALHAKGIDDLFVRWVESCARFDTGGECRERISNTEWVAMPASTVVQASREERPAATEVFRWKSCAFGNLEFRVGDCVSFRAPVQSRAKPNERHPSEFGRILYFETTGTEDELHEEGDKNGAAAAASGSKDKTKNKRSHIAQTIWVHLRLLPEEAFPEALPLTVNSVYLDKIAPCQMIQRQMLQLAPAVSVQRRTALQSQYDAEQQRMTAAVVRRTGRLAELSVSLDVGSSSAIPEPLQRSLLAFGSVGNSAASPLAWPKGMQLPQLHVRLHSTFEKLPPYSAGHIAAANHLSPYVVHGKSQLPTVIMCCELRLEVLLAENKWTLLHTEWSGPINWTAQMRKDGVTVLFRPGGPVWGIISDAFKRHSADTLFRLSLRLHSMHPSLTNSNLPPKLEKLVAAIAQQGSDAKKKGEALSAFVRDHTIRQHDLVLLTHYFKVKCKDDNTHAHTTARRH